MSSTTNARKPRQRQPREHARSVSCEPAGHGTGADYFVQVIQDGELHHYWLRRLASDFGVAFEFQQSRTAELSAMQAESYDVCLDGQHGTCECPGHLRWGVECKHLWALRELVRTGRVPAVPHGDGCPCEGCRRLAEYKPAGADHGLPF